MAADDFRIPSIPTLEPARVDYSGLMQATRELQNSKDQGVSALFKGAEQVATYIYGLAVASNHAQAQNDAAAVGEKWDNLAADTVQQKKYTFEPNQLAEAGGGEAVPLEQRDQKVLRLDPSFDQTVESDRRALMDKFKNFPGVQDSLMGMLRPMSDNAYRNAHDKAQKQILEDGQAAVLDSAERYAKMAAQSGDSAPLDALLANKDNQGLFSAEAWQRLKDKSAATFQQGRLFKVGNDALKSVSLEEAQNAVVTTAQKLGIDDTSAIVQAASRLDLIQRQKTFEYKQTADQEKADAVKAGKSLETAADELDAKAEYPSVMHQFTDSMRVDGQMEPVKHFLQIGQETAASNLRDYIADKNKWSDAQRKYSQTAFDSYQKDFTAKDQGTANNILDWWADTRSALMLGSYDGGAQGAVRQVRSMMIDGKAQNVWGKQSDEAMNHALGELQTTITREGRPNAPSDRSTLMRWENDVIGKGLDAATISGMRPRLNADFIGKKLNETDYKMFTKIIASPADMLLSHAGGELRALYTDKNNVLDAVGFSQAYNSVIAWKEQNPTKSASEVQDYVEGVIQAKKGEIGAAAVQSKNPEQSQNAWQQFWNAPSTDQQRLTTAMTAVASGNLARDVNAKAPGALQAATKIQNLQLADFRQHHPDATFEGMAKTLFTAGGKQYVAAFKDAARGSNAVWGAEWDGRTWKWQKVPGVTWQMVGGK